MTDDDLDIRLQWTLPSHLAHLADDINPLVESVAQQAVHRSSEAAAGWWIKFFVSALVESDVALPAEAAQDIETSLRGLVGLQQRPRLRLVVDNTTSGGDS